MIKKGVIERYLDSLLKGNRTQCRAIIEEALQSGTPANSVYLDILWPMMVEIEKLLRADKITIPQEHMATRINRTIVDQLQNKLPRKASRDKKIVICCSAEDAKELGAQMISDLFESDGWEVKFLGGGLANDDILAFVHEYAPDILLIYGTEPKQAPGIRGLIDTTKEVNAWPNMRIMVSGGLFKRAEGLWEEMGADFYAETAADAVQQGSCEMPLPIPQRTINRRKKRAKKTVANAVVTGK